MYMILAITAFSIPFRYMPLPIAAKHTILVNLFRCDMDAARVPLSLVDHCDGGNDGLVLLGENPVESPLSAVAFTMASTTSMPSVTLPKEAYWPLSEAAVFWTMKNCELAEL